MADTKLNPKGTYRLYNDDGTYIESKGDNQYFQQAFGQNLPISVTSKGEWYVTPYMEFDAKNGVTAHLPSWFKNSPEYSQWKTFASQIPNSTLTDEVKDDLTKILEGLGNQSLARNEVKQMFKSNFKIEDDKLAQKYLTSMQQLYAEGQGKGDAKLIGIFGSDKEESIKDIARDFKNNMSKDELNEQMKFFNYVLSHPDKYDAETVVDSAILNEVLNYVDDNYMNFGEEFKGLLEASTFQKLYLMGTGFMNTMTEGIFGIPARLAYGVGNVIKDGKFDARIEDQDDKIIADNGGYLEGVEGFVQVGQAAGVVGNIAGTYGVMALTGGASSGAALSTGGWLSKIGLPTIAGGMVTDFVFNDLPIDIMMFITDWGRTDSPEKAWYNSDPKEQQPLFGHLLLSQFSPLNIINPKVPGGLAMNLLGDAIIDLAGPIIALTGSTAFKQLDNMSNGGISRMKAKAAITNLSIQNKLTNTPVFGTAWKKFINHMMGAENAEFIRQARKAAIAKNSMDPYIFAQNLLTIKNHGGAEAVMPLFKKLESDMKVTEDISKFIKNANKYGGFGEVKIKWSEIDNAAVKESYKVVADVLPKDIKEGLLLADRLSELKGEDLNEGGILTNPMRDKEIADISARLEQLKAAHPELEGFINKFSDLNKAVERMSVGLGIKTEEWVDALQLDPRFENYMTRQMLVPGSKYQGTGQDGIKSSIWDKGRKGGAYRIDLMLDPTVALNMKVAALGRAFANNEQAKMVAANARTTGGIYKGKKAMDTATRLAAAKEKVKNAEAIRKEVNYDGVVGKFSSDTSKISNTFREVNDLLNLPNTISLRASYSNFQDAKIRNVVNDFRNGKIKFAEGVKEEAGLSDSDAADIITNTYQLTGQKVKSDVDSLKENIQVFDDSYEPKILGDAAREIDLDNGLKNVINQHGEVDFGKNLTSSFNFADGYPKDFPKAKKQEIKEWHDGMVKYANAHSDNGKDPNAFIKACVEYSKNNPKPYQAELDDYSKKASKQLKNTLSGLVDSETKTEFGHIQELTRGEVRRALYQEGYDNIKDSKIKKDIDEADSLFTQKTSTPLIVYRGESSGTARNLKVGDKIDTSSYTYTAMDTDYTSTYRRGLTTMDHKVKKFDGGYLYRYHIEPGSPVFYRPDGDIRAGLYTSSGSMQELILPRGVDATVVSIKKDIKGVFSPFKNPRTVVDVVIKANTGVAPKLNINNPSKALSDAAADPGAVNMFDNAAKPGKVDTESKITTNAGMTSNGVPYTYKVENGQVTSIEKIESTDGYAKALTRASGGIYKVSPSVVSAVGTKNAAGLNRTMMFYRDQFPNLPFTMEFRYDSHTTSWGYVWREDNMGLHALDTNGKLVMTEGTFGVFVGPEYRAGNEAELLRKKKAEVADGFKPKNTGTVESTPDHESGHSILQQLNILTINKSVDEGKTDLRKLSPDALAKHISDQHHDLLWEVLEGALNRIGVKTEGMTVRELDDTVYRYAKTISGYAADKTYGYDHKGRLDRDEIVSETMRMYHGNGEGSSPYCKAVFEELKERSSRFANAAVPYESLLKNDIPEGNYKTATGKVIFNNDGSYKFPASAKTDKQKAKWLDTVRQANPFNKGKLTEESYRQANVWDTFFQKEIAAIDPKQKTTMPDSLAKRNGDFLEAMNKDVAKKITEKLKAQSIEGFDTELATMVLSKNTADLEDSMTKYIVKRVEDSAKELAGNMPGGATKENLENALLTLWSDDNVKNDITNMVTELIPDLTPAQVKQSMDTLFKDQVEGLASAQALPIEVKTAQSEVEELREQLVAENKKTLKAGKDLDKHNLKYFTDDSTHIIHYREGGEDVYVVVKDPVVASVLRRPDFKSTGVNSEAFITTANTISRLYRLTTTSINPLAVVRNVLRDPFQAATTAGWNPLTMNLDPTSFYRTLVGFGLDEKVIQDVIGRIKTNATMGTMTNEMRKLGYQNPNSIGYSSGAEKVSKKINSALDGEGFAGKIVEWGEAPLEAWESIFRTQVAQQSFIKNFEKTKDVDKAMAYSMFTASNATTNFSHSVGLFKNATSTVPYLSSAINGTASFWRLFNMDPIGMITRITAGFMVPVMAITAWNLSDDERRKAYMNLDSWYRDSHLVLMDLEGNAISFPVPDEINNYFNLAKNLIEYTQEASPYSLGTIFAQGALGFLPSDINGFWDENGQFTPDQGFAQFASGLMPQAATAIYEFFWQRDTYTGQDLSEYNLFNRFLNLTSNIVGTGVKNIANDIGMLLGASEKDIIGKSTADTLARDLFGIGFNAAKNQFMELIGNKSSVDPTTGKETKATGLFAENEKLQKQIENLNSQIAFAADSEKDGLERQKDDLVNAFIERVGNLTNKYMQLFSITGGLEDWQKEKIVQILTLGKGTSSADSDMYQQGDALTQAMNEKALGRERYLQAGLPGGPSLENIALSPDGSYNNSIELQAAINKFYGVTKQANYDLSNLIDDSQIKDIRSKFYNAVSKIYDIAEENNVKPDYDMIEKIQARYLQSVDAILAPIINKYGINILNNNDFVDQVRRLVNGMIPSNDWKRSEKNAKKYLSAKEFPLATVDVKDWLKKRYTSGMVNRNLSSDPEVTNQLKAIKADIDAGRKGSAKGKIESLKTGINKSSYYISATDYQTLTKYYNMVK